MNKILRYSLMGLMTVLCGLLRAQTTVKFDFTGETAYGMALLSGNSSEYNPDPYTLTEGDVTAVLKGKNRWWSTSGGNELRFYASSSIELSVPEGSVITSVKLTAKAVSNFGTATGTYDNGEWTGTAETVTINCTITKSNTPVTAIEVTYQGSETPAKKAPKLAFGESQVSANLGSEFTVPTLSKETTAEVVYSSSDEAVATVDAATGDVTLVAAGTAVITATAEENEEYMAGSASYTIIVSEAIRTEVTEPYEETFEAGLGSFTIENVTLEEGLSYVWSHDSKYKYMKALAFVGGSNKASESWLVSPVIEIAETEVVRYVSFDQCINKYFGTVSEEATLWVREQGGEWKQLAITYPELPEGKNWSAFETQKVSLAGYEGRKIQLGFKYVSTSEAAGTWEIKNFSVNTSGDETAIGKVEAAAARKDGAVYNLAGQRVEKALKGINIRDGKKFIVK